jgi:molybdopterin-guanine dinucleotide biosynthesis protein B
MTPIVCVVGTSGSGKTFVVAKLVAELKRRGHRVATIKHDVHDFEIDKEGKDSWQHARAGSDTVVISSPKKVAMISKVDHDSSLSELADVIGGGFDIVIAEGYKRSGAPKIEVHRRELKRDLLCSERELVAVATDEFLDISSPQYSPDDARGLADLLESEFIKKETRDEAAVLAARQPVPIGH